MPISIFGLICSITFILLSFLGRFLFPFGDEPDFNVRAERLVNAEHPWWSPYNLFSSFIRNFNIDASYCQIDSTRLSLWSYIGDGCFEGLEQVLMRFVMTILITSPLLFVIVFRKQFITLMKIIKIDNTPELWHRKLDALSLAMIFPGMIYYLGVLAEEQFVLVLSLFIFLFLESIIVVFFLLTMIFTIDIGNALVILSFLSFIYFFTFINRLLGVYLTILLMITILILSFNIGPNILLFISDFSVLESKANAIYELVVYGEDKYPLILRPIITFITTIFMTPSGIKIIILYLIYFVVLILVYKRIIIFSISQKNNLLNKSFLLFNTSVVTVLFFVFMFPHYSFGKYYIFTLPFIFHTLLFVYKKQNIMYFMIISNLIVFINLILYRI